MFWFQMSFFRGYVINIFQGAAALPGIHHPVVDNTIAYRFQLNTNRILGILDKNYFFILFFMRKLLLNFYQFLRLGKLFRLFFRGGPYPAFSPPAFDEIVPHPAAGLTSRQFHLFAVALFFQAYPQLNLPACSAHVRQYSEPVL